MLNLRTLLLGAAIERLVSLAVCEENETFRAIYINALRKLEHELRAEERTANTETRAVRHRAALS